MRVFRTGVPQWDSINCEKNSDSTLPQPSFVLYTLVYTGRGDTGRQSETVGDSRRQSETVGDSGRQLETVADSQWQTVSGRHDCKIKCTTQNSAGEVLRFSYWSTAVGLHKL